MTKLDWWSSYLPIYAYAFSDRYMVASVSFVDAAIRKLIAHERPAEPAGRHRDGAQAHSEALLLFPKTLASEPLFKNNQAK